MPPRLSDSQAQLEQDALCTALLRALGGANNIERLSHCTTRLRVRLYDSTRVERPALKGIKAVLNVIAQGQELQLILNRDVDLLCASLKLVLGQRDEDAELLSKEKLEPREWPRHPSSDLATKSSELTEDPMALLLNHGSKEVLAATQHQGKSEEDANHSLGLKVKTKVMECFGFLTSMVAASFMPVIGFLVVTAFISTLTGLLVLGGVLDPSDRLYLFLNFNFDLMLAFLPVLVGYNCARWAKSSSLVSIILGMCLVPPFYQQLSALMPGFEQITLPLLRCLQHFVFTRFDFTVYEVSILPILAATLLNARLEHWLVGIIPKSLHNVVMPLVCLCFCIPLLILFIAPFFTVLGYVISSHLVTIYEHSPWLLGLVLGSLWEVLVCFGLHLLTTPVMVNNLSLLGYDMLTAIVMVPTAATAGAMLGNYLYLRWERRKVGVKQALAEVEAGDDLGQVRNGAILAVIFGITEPTLYTYLIRRSKLLALICLVGGVGGLLVAIAGVRMYSLSFSSTFAFVLSYRFGTSDSIFPLICYVVIILSCFSLTTALSFGWRRRERAPKAKPITAQKEGETSLTAVAAGQYVPLTEVNDPIFSALMLGDGYALTPSEDVIYAPCAGTLSEDIVFAHAVGIKGPLGAEILVHVGINTVRLEGKHFTLLKEPGTAVAQGEAILRFEREAISAAGYDSTIMVLCTLPEGVQLAHNLKVKAGDKVEVGQELLTLSK